LTQYGRYLARIGRTAISGRRSSTGLFGDGADRPGFSVTFEIGSIAILLAF